MTPHFLIHLLLTAWLAFACLMIQAQTTFTLAEVPPTYVGQRIGLRGNLPPLSWEETLWLSPQADGSYAVEVAWPMRSQASVLAYKYVAEQVDQSIVYELAGQSNRLEILTNSPPSTLADQWNILRTVTIPALPLISADSLQADLEVIRMALDIHPGRRRYLTEAAQEAALAELSLTFQEDLSYADAYLAISRMLAKLRCGHTYANYYNQPDLLKVILHRQANKVPFAMKWVGRRAVITRDLSAKQQIGAPAELVAIDGMPMSEMLDTLLTYVKGDGMRENMRLHSLQILADGSYEPFDVFFPLLFPPQHGQYTLSLVDSGGVTRQVVVEAVDLPTRTARLSKRFPGEPRRYDDTWQFRMLAEDIGYLQLGDFSTYKMSMDWKAFLKDAFTQLVENEVPNLIVDIRDNEGGMDEVNLELGRYLIQEPFLYQPFLYRTAYEYYPEALKPYTGSWDMSPMDLHKDSEPDGDLFINGGMPKPEKMKEGDRAYRGNIYLMINAANSSATFYLANYARQSGTITLVGQETGGNRRGVNGGHMWFINLPHSRIEFDIPVFASFPLTDQPDRGIVPDVVIPQSIEGLLSGKDYELAATVHHIQQND